MSRTIFRSLVWAGVRARGSPAVLSGGGGAKTSKFVMKVILPLTIYIVVGNNIHYKQLSRR